MTRQPVRHPPGLRPREGEIQFLACRGGPGCAPFRLMKHQLLLMACWAGACFHSRLRFWILPIVSTLVLLSPAGNQGAQTSEVQAVIQAEYAGSPGPGSTMPIGVPGSRYQNIYNGSDILSAMPRGGYITQIAFRSDEGNLRSYATFIPDIEIRMSTSPATGPDHISKQFSANVGPDETVVFGRTSVTFTVVAGGGAVNPFEIIFPLTRPFYYDPTKGSLAVDILTYQEAVGPYPLLDSGRSLARAGGIALGASSTLLGAPVIQLTFLPVPEPRMLVISVISLAISLARRLAAL